MPGQTIVQGMTPAVLEARQEEEKRQLYLLHLVFAGEEGLRLRRCWCYVSGSRRQHEGEAIGRATGGTSGRLGRC